MVLARLAWLEELESTSLALLGPPFDPAVRGLHADHVSALVHHLPLGELRQLGLRVPHIEPEALAVVELRIHQGRAHVSVSVLPHLQVVHPLAESPDGFSKARV